ncbi:unnamed protein product [Protopolystoma xenopodis]|uniref:Uncharacterized protein n=1 Tax=Protopolystoma xenopodis TaxID=117903 RepID=A0A3S5CRD9_9PLAT|nr:unnamed protein product [Protopolystoma xenopodis]
MASDLYRTCRDGDDLNDGPAGCTLGRDGEDATLGYMSGSVASATGPCHAYTTARPATVSTMFSRCPFRCPDTWVKSIYLACATLITATFIVECILLHLVIIPYVHESGFTETTCYFVSSDMAGQPMRCENKCSKDRSHFPCLRVKVKYEKERANHSAIMFDNIATYQHYKQSKVRSVCKCVLKCGKRVESMCHARNRIVANGGFTHIKTHLVVTAKLSTVS